MEEEKHGIGPTNGVINFSPNVTNSTSSNCSTTTNTNTNTTTTNNNNKTQDRFVSHTNTSNKEQDRFLPIANVGRIMKKEIPGNGKISKDAKETVQECVSEFISFVTGEASDKCQREKRKTINGDDIIWAITTLGFEDYVMPLKQYLNRYRELEGEKLNVPKRQRIHSHSHDHQKPNVVAYPNHVYSSSPFVSADQPLLSLPFAQNLVQQQLQAHDQLDSIGQG